MRWRRLLGAALLIAATIALAPLLYGVGKGVFAGSSDGDRRAQSVALLAAYRDHWPPPIALASIIPDAAIRDCGYDDETLFGSNRGDFGRNDRWSPYGGFFELWLERSQDWHRRLEQLRLARLEAGTSAFSSEFLRVCIRQSLFASACATRVRLILESGDLDLANGDAWPHNAPLPDQSRQNHNICTYLDGLAARRGLPLAGVAGSGATMAEGRGR